MNGVKVARNDYCFFLHWYWFNLLRIYYSKKRCTTFVKSVFELPLFDAE